MWKKKKNIAEWVSYLENLSDIAKKKKKQPQVACSAFTRSFQPEWSFLQRVVSDREHLFDSLEDVIFNCFLPSLFGASVSAIERVLFTLPVRMGGGLNIKNPVDSSSKSYRSSREAASYLVQCIKGMESYELEVYEEVVSESQNSYKSNVCVVNKQQFVNVLLQFLSNVQRSIRRAKDSLISWLTVLPLAKEHFDLSKYEFRDSLSLRYAKPFLDLHATRLRWLWITPHC